MVWTASIGREGKLAAVCKLSRIWAYYKDTKTWQLLKQQLVILVTFLLKMVRCESHSGHGNDYEKATFPLCEFTHGYTYRGYPQMFT